MHTTVVFKTTDIKDEKQWSLRDRKPSWWALTPNQHTALWEFRDNSTRHQNGEGQSPGSQGDRTEGGKNGAVRVLRLEQERRENVTENTGNLRIPLEHSWNQNLGMSHPKKLRGKRIRGNSTQSTPNSRNGVCFHHLERKNSLLTGHWTEHRKVGPQ